MWNGGPVAGPADLRWGLNCGLQGTGYRLQPAKSVGLIDVLAEPKETRRRCGATTTPSAAQFVGEVASLGERVRAPAPLPPEVRPRVAQVQAEGNPPDEVVRQAEDDRLPGPAAGRDHHHQADGAQHLAREP